MNAYVVFYGSRQTKLYAATSLDACQKGIEFFRVPKSKQHLVSAHLVGKDGEEVQQVLP